VDNSNIPKERRYSAEDEWVLVEGDRVLVGVSDYAQQQLGDIVFVELPEVGSKVARGEAFGVIESVKAVSDLFAPVSGVVAKINEQLADAPEGVNEDCYGEKGWLIAIEPSDEAEFDALMEHDAYLEFIASRED
jgi:glycine cleavage system H protein